MVLTKILAAGDPWPIESEQPRLDSTLEMRYSLRANMELFGPN